jgi:hypothetical protein
VTRVQNATRVEDSLIGLSGWARHRAHFKSAVILNQKAASRLHSSLRLRTAMNAHTPRLTAQDSRRLLLRFALRSTFVPRGSLLAKSATRFVHRCFATLNQPG